MSIDIRPTTVSINDAKQMSGLSRSAIYRKLVAGEILAVKSGSRTLIVVESLLNYLTSLPPATFRAPAKKRGVR
jgi:hypothetical protein